MDVQAAFESLRRGWHFVVIGAVAAGLAGLLFSAAQPAVYESTASYIISPTQANPDSAGEAIRTLDDARSRAIMTTYVEVLTSGTTVRDAFVSIGLTADAAEDYEVTAVVAPEANVAELTIRGADERLVAVVSGAVGQVGSQRFVDLYEFYDVALLDPAENPGSAAGRSPIITAAAAAMLGVLAGAVVALLVAAPRIRRSRNMRRRISSYGDAGASVTPINDEGERFLRVTSAG